MRLSLLAFLAGAFLVMALGCRDDTAPTGATAPDAQATMVKGLKGGKARLEPPPPPPPPPP